MLQISSVRLYTVTSFNYYVRLLQWQWWCFWLHTICKLLYHLCQDVIITTIIITTTTTITLIIISFLHQGFEYLCPFVSHSNFGMYHYSSSTYNTYKWNVLGIGYISWWELAVNQQFFYEMNILWNSASNMWIL